MAREEFSGIDHESYQDGYRDGRLDALDECLTLVRQFTRQYPMVLTDFMKLRAAYEDDHPGMPGKRRR
jgi:hypothetical protein